MRSFFIIGLSGFLGAVFRYEISLLLKHYTFPWSTFAVNMLGCFLIGVAATKLSSGSNLYLLFAVGFLSSFTTFATFGLDSLKLLQTQNFYYLALNIVAQVLLGILLVFFGTKV